MKKKPVKNEDRNMYADLGFSNPDEWQAKAEIASLIYDIIHHRHLTQKEAGNILGINQPKVSALLNGNLKGFSMERLVGFLVTLGRDVEIIVKKKPRTRPNAHLRVSSPGRAKEKRVTA